MKKQLLSVVVPCYNEEEVIAKTYADLTKVLCGIKMDYELIFVNDGSKDNTYVILNAIANKDIKVKILDFSRNFGHQAAVSAGICYASGDCAVIIDADLQDPPAVILELIKKWEEGYEVVNAIRLKREGETWFKKVTAKAFYRFLNAITGQNMQVDCGDFRLIDAKVLEVFRNLKEKNRYIRGLMSWVGFKTANVLYEREKRYAGETKYTLSKMLKLASDGIFSFTYKPLQYATRIGVVISMLSFLGGAGAIYQKLINNTVSGWTSLILLVSFLGGVQLIFLGLIGEYIGRIFEESKDRPIFIVRDQKNFDNNRNLISMHHSKVENF